MCEDFTMLLSKHEWLSTLSLNRREDIELAERAYDILNGNIYPADGGYLWSPYRCLTPGNNKFKGIWNWDSAFHAIGLARWDTELAKESILGFLKFQKENGLLPDVIRENGSIVDAYSKPPVFAWATEILYHRGADIEFVKAVYPKLALNSDWWENERCDRGLFFYDSADKDNEQYLLHVQYETGWDNSARWDEPANEYWAIDLNCFMYMFYRAMANLASFIELCDEEKIWEEKASRLAGLINKKLWSDENGYDNDVNRFTGKISSALTPASFMPLFAMIATTTNNNSNNFLFD